MCYAIPGKVKEVKGRSVLIDYFGEEKRVINEMGGILRGDYLYAQGGYAIKKIPQDEALSILSTWKETFFELQEMDLRLSRIDFKNKGIDKKLLDILDKTLERAVLSKDDLCYLFSANNEESREFIYKSANFLRHKYHRNSCCVHGIIEISNHCRQSCLYCGINKENKSIRRYRMSEDEIIRISCEAVEAFGFGALVLQSGEDPFYTPEKLAEVIKRIKERAGVLVCISFGEVGIKGLKKLYQAGARALLMRFETSNQAAYEALHPGRKLSTRLRHLKEAKNLGYLIITGALIGLPNQKKEDLLEDFYLARELGTEMYSFGPFIPHPSTALAKAEPPSAEDILKSLALIRFLDPEKAKILVTTAFETLYPDARRKGLLSGASSLMLNITPLRYRRNYEIYPHRAHESSPINSQIEETLKLLRSLGRAPTDLGVK